MTTDEYGYDLDRGRQMRFANRHHYYWLPCPICGFETGGHEYLPGDPSVPIQGRPGIYQGVCRRHPNAENEYKFIAAHVERLSHNNESGV